MNYRDERKQLLIEYLKSLNIEYKTDGKHKHVLAKKYTDLNIVPSIRKLGYKTVFNKKKTIESISNEKNTFKLDSRANNITSSSMLSACFFAYYVENQALLIQLITDLFLERFNKQINIQNNVKVELEWIDKNGDQSHIDAFVEFESDNESYRIFIEVKYCEEAYGPKKRYEKESMAYERKLKARKDYIENCKKWFSFHEKLLNLKGYMSDCVTADDFENSKYSQRYQIIRNISHASLLANDYCLFLLAKGNSEAVQDIYSGLEELKKQNEELINKRVAVLFFEDVLDQKSDLYSKYFA